VPFDVRATRAAAKARAAQRPRGPELHAVDDRTLGGVPVRHYRPAAERRPALVYLHGGFWLIGDLDTHDRWCRRMAAQASIDVIAVAYRLAPEHPWPAAVQDAIAVLRAVPGAAVGGDSAGACVAALAALALRDDPARPAAQVLVCPNTDLTGAQPSMDDNNADGGLDPADVRWAAAQWVPDTARHADGDVSPLHATDLTGAPPALVVTAGRDPLRDEGDAYARRLADAGVPVVHRREAGLPHGFIQGLDLTDAAAAAACDRLLRDLAALMG
jgi:acetyl esterase